MQEKPKEDAIKQKNNMLSSKLIEFFKSKGWWYDDYSQQYADVITDLNISLDSSFGQFYLHVEDGPTFLNRGYQLYQICWFSLNSSYNLDIKRTHDSLHLPLEYLPLDSFEGEGGFFYNRKTEEVLELELGQELNNFLSGKLKPQWRNFNEFLEWFFG